MNLLRILNMNSEGYGKFKGDLSEIVKDFLINFKKNMQAFIILMT